MYHRLMIVVEDDTPSRFAVEEGLRMAQALGAEVLFFHPLPVHSAPIAAMDLPPLGALDAQEHEQLVRERGERLLADAAARASALGVRSHGAVSHGMETAPAVAQAAQEQHCDLLVVGSHGRTAMQRLIHGSLPASLLPLTPVPMLVCRKREPDLTAAHAEAEPAGGPGAVQPAA